MTKIEKIIQSEPLFRTFAHFPLFTGVKARALTSLFIAAREIVVPAGTVIVKENDPGEELFIVGKGKVDVIKSLAQKDETFLTTLGENECFGEMCVIEPIVRSASVVAKERSILYAIPSNCLNKFYLIWPKEHTTIMKNLSQILANRIALLDHDFLPRAN